MEFVSDANTAPLETVLSTILKDEVSIDVVILPSGSQSFNLRINDEFIGSLVYDNERRIRLESSLYLQQQLMPFGAEIRAGIAECYVRT